MERHLSPDKNVCEETMNHASTESILKALKLKLEELRRMKNQPQLLGRWAHTFASTCLGFDTYRDYRSFYSATDRNWRPILVLAHTDLPFCTLEVGPPTIKRHKDIPYGLLFTGTEWRLYDMHSEHGPGLMAVCDLAPLLSHDLRDEDIVELEKDLSPFHEASYQTKFWETLAEENRRSSPESMAQVLLSRDVLLMLQERLGIKPRDPQCHKLLHYKVVDMLQSKTPVKVKLQKLKIPDSTAA